MNGNDCDLLQWLGTTDWIISLYLIIFLWFGNKLTFMVGSYHFKKKYIIKISILK